MRASFNAPFFSGWVTARLAPTHRRKEIPSRSLLSHVTCALLLCSHTQGFDYDKVYYFASTTGGTSTIGIEGVDDPGLGGLCNSDAVRFSILTVAEPGCNVVCCNSTVGQCFRRTDSAIACSINSYLVSSENGKGGKKREDRKTWWLLRKRYHAEEGCGKKGGKEKGGCCFMR